jgi:outer membrane immunogenic protein
MELMKKLFVSVSALVALGGTFAQAADLPARIYTKAPVMAPVDDWTGFYIGAHAGYGWGSAKFSDPRFTPGWSLTNDMDGAIAGGQVGFNRQFGRFVLGIEGDISWSGIEGNATDVAPFAGDQYNSKAKWLGTVTGRFGYVVDHALLYAKAGGAFGDFEYNYHAVGFGPSQGTATRAGWTVGAGIEYAIAPAWSVKAEYNYLDFGTKTLDIVPLTDGFTADIDQKVHLFKVGVNYKLGR